MAATLDFQMYRGGGEGGVSGIIAQKGRGTRKIKYRDCNTLPPKLPLPLSKFDTHARWLPVTQSARSRRSYGKIKHCEQSITKRHKGYWLLTAVKVTRWECAAWFSKPLPYFRPKNVIFLTRFQTLPLKSILNFERKDQLTKKKERILIKDLRQL